MLYESLLKSLVTKKGLLKKLKLPIAISLKP